VGPLGRDPGRPPHRVVAGLRDGKIAAAPQRVAHLFFPESQVDRDGGRVRDRPELGGGFGRRPGQNLGGRRRRSGHDDPVKQLGGAIAERQRIADRLSSRPADSRRGSPVLPDPGRCWRPLPGSWHRFASGHLPPQLETDAFRLSHQRIDHGVQPLHQGLKGRRRPARMGPVPALRPGPGGPGLPHARPEASVKPLHLRQGWERRQNAQPLGFPAVDPGQHRFERPLRRFPAQPAPGELGDGLVCAVPAGRDEPLRGQPELAPPGEEV